MNLFSAAFLFRIAAFSFIQTGLFDQCSRKDQESYIKWLPAREGSDICMVSGRENSPMNKNKKPQRFHMATATKNVKTASKNTKTAAPKNSAKNAKSKVEVNPEVSVQTPTVETAVAETPAADVMGFVTEESVEDVLQAFAQAEAAAIASAALAAAEVSEEVFAAVETEVVAETEVAPVTTGVTESNEEYFVGTVHELAAKLNLEYVIAHGFARYLAGAGVATVIGQRKVEGKRGRCASIYRIPRNANIQIPV